MKLPLHSLALLASVFLLGIAPATAQLVPDPTQSTRPESEPAPSSSPVTAPVTVATSGGVAEEGTSKDNRDAETLKEIEREIEVIDGEFKKLEKEKTDLLSVRIFSRGNDRGLDFEKQHNEMLQVFTDTAKLLNRFQLISGRSTAVLSRLLPIKGSGLLSEEVIKLETVKKNGAGLQALIDKSLAEVAAYRAELNNQLIEDVHRYQIKNSFRSTVGIVWLVCFLTICAGLIYLLKIGVLSASESSTLQLMAMILIIFVIVLFGIADVMGENGVTGLLAALAGYILGKSSTGSQGQGADIAEIIAAAQGRTTQKPVPQGDEPHKEGEA